MSGTNHGDITSKFNECSHGKRIGEGCRECWEETMDMPLPSEGFNIRIRNTI